MVNLIEGRVKVVAFRYCKHDCARKSHTCSSKTKCLCWNFRQLSCWSFFNQGALNGNNYLDILEETVVPRITEISEIDDNLMINDLTFQHYGAPHTMLLLSDSN